MPFWGNQHSPNNLKAICEDGGKLTVCEADPWEDFLQRNTNGMFMVRQNKLRYENLRVGQSTSSPSAFLDSRVKLVPYRVFRSSSPPLHLYGFKQYLPVPSRRCPHIRSAGQRPPATSLHSSCPPGSGLLQRTRTRGKTHLQ